jgi:orotidine-5'-phosphate decarboxylase
MTAEEKYNARVDAINSLLCVGLDPDFEKLPDVFKKEEYPQFAFNKWIIDETREFAAAYKPNSAFYEAQGPRGLAELKMTAEYLQQTVPEAFTIVDIKRGDIGNTNQAYAQAYYDYYGFDAVTMHPYMGKEPLQYFLARKDKACIILVRTSNPGAGEFQDMLVEGIPLWQVVAKRIRDEWNENGNCMLVIGAPYPEELKKARELMCDMTFLVPGVGSQGGDVRAVIQAGKNSFGKGLIINASRSILFSSNPRDAARTLRDEINVA